MRRGLGYMALGALFFSIMSVFVKLAGRTLPSQEIVLARGVVTLVLSAFAVWRLKLDPWGKRRGLLFLRGLFGFGGLSCFYYSVTTLPLGDATVIQYTNPLFTALFAGLFLRERTHAAELVVLVTSLAGVTMVAQPHFLFRSEATALPTFSVAVALLGAVFSAAAYTTVRELRTSDHPLVIVFYFPLVAVPASVPPLVPVAEWPTGIEWALLLGVGVSTQVAQVFMTRGLHLEPAGRATAVGNLQVVLAFGWGFLLFGEAPEVWTVAGAVLVVGSVLALALYAGTESARLSETRSNDAAGSTR